MTSSSKLLHLSVVSFFLLNKVKSGFNRLFLNINHRDGYGISLIGLAVLLMYFNLGLANVKKANHFQKVSSLNPILNQFF